MTNEIKTKRDTLKELSGLVKEAVAKGVYKTINEGLVALYKEQGHSEINSFKRWLQLGKIVRKGEKALLLWGEPMKVKKQEKKVDDNKDEYEYFPLAYVFSNKQVEPLQKE